LENAKSPQDRRPRLKKDKGIVDLIYMDWQKTQHSSARRILVVDQDSHSLGVLLEPLKWEGYDTRGESSVRDALRVAESYQPHIVIVDTLINEDFLKALSIFKRKLPHASILLISDDSSTESIIAGLDAGADDYIIKPFVPLELLARIRTQLRIRDLSQQLILVNEKLKELVDIDDLTGLFNMRSLYQKLEFEIERGKRFNRGICVVMMDMDCFKSVNDGHDHLFGSFVISQVGKIVKQCTRNIDIPARYGGDEFLVVLTEVTHEGALLFCERLRKAIEKTTFRIGNDSIKLTASVGFAITKDGESISSRELVRRADHALYHAKRTGRNRVCFFDEIEKEKSKDKKKVS
jgi:two-component system cell cycle response regulator